MTETVIYVALLSLSANVIIQSFKNRKNDRILKAISDNLEAQQKLNSSNEKFNELVMESLSVLNERVNFTQPFE